MRALIGIAAAVAFFAAAACDSGTTSAAVGESPHGVARAQKTPGYIVDSVFTMEEELRRFRADMEITPTAFSHALESREALARAFLKAAAASDTTALRSMHVSREEFAYLYFPTSKFARAPYELPPALVWFQITSQSDQGITKLIATVTNTAPRLEQISCSDERIEGENRVWSDCLTRWRDGKGKSRVGRIFGEILERDGKFKLLSFANDL